MSPIGRESVRRAAVLIVASLALLGLVTPAAGAADAKAHDRADNSFEFTYDSQSGIESAQSGIIVKRRDPVQFTVGVSERASSLSGRVVLELARDRALRYTGTITFTVTDDTGAVAYTEDRAIDVTLRQKRGQRSTTLRIPFSVPSGHYFVTATFESS